MAARAAFSLLSLEYEENTRVMREGETSLVELTSEHRLQSLFAALSSFPAFADLVRALSAGQPMACEGVWGSASALVAAALARHAPGPVVVVSAHLDEIEPLADELAVFSDGWVEGFPGWEIPPEDVDVCEPVFADRLRVLKRLAGLSHTELPPPPVAPPPPSGPPLKSFLGRKSRNDADVSEGAASDAVPKPHIAGAAGMPSPPREALIIATSIHALLEPVPHRELILKSTRTLSVGDEIQLDALLAWLVERGLRNMTAVELPGEFSQRGGILDLFAPDWTEPVRIEFFGDTIESIRRFDVGSQRSLAGLKSIDLTILPEGFASDAHFASHLPAGTWFVLLEPGELDEQGRRWLHKLTKRRGLFTADSTVRRMLEFPAAGLTQLPAKGWDAVATLHVESVERFQGSADRFRGMVDHLEPLEELYVICPGPTEAEQLAAELSPQLERRPGKIHFPLGRMRTGFRLPLLKSTFISGGELLGRREPPRKAGRRQLGRSIDSFLELREGDYVVHVSHGIARYQGLKMLESDLQREEHLELEFHGGTKIYVPSSKIDLVQKYVGGTKIAPPLSRIGGKMWTRRKKEAEEAVIDLASDMLELQAARASRSGIKFPEDSLWYKQFEENFPFTETPDQVTALAAIKQDMEAPRSMDRLICGDVGYGKTELAMRAAFKAIDAGYQVAVLVPTTILAEQHFRSFSERMKGFPFEIGVLSRFRTKAQQQKIIEGLAAGSIDLVIGTHRIVQPDVNFHNLGLVVIDEEQRFGVEAKERLKVVRQLVDVLTLTATPIPRTLHLSLLGIRDISNLETPPADRLAVETRVTRWDPTLIEYALERELGRGGQVFFVHNRIHDMDKIAHKLRAMVPHARIGIAHGQMPEDELAQAMLDFVEHKYDILLSTTIVESGLDIPTANTIFIDDADKYGLAELHQLRGRVGRYKHRAYCYLLVNKHGALSDDAAKRLRAIEEFSSMGAGFNIAMRDLEIRGTGNILGTEQSGHIAAVGYELYCRLLEHAVRRLKELPPQEKVEVNIDLPGEAYLPRNYIPDMRIKIDLYRRLARVTQETELAELTSELGDRFGRPPEVVDRLLRLSRLRIWAHQQEIATIHLEGPFAVLRYKSRNKIAALVLKSKGKLRVVDAQSAYLPLASENLPGERLYSELEALLRPA